MHRGVGLRFSLTGLMPCDSFEGISTNEIVANGERVQEVKDKLKS